MPRVTASSPTFFLAKWFRVLFLKCIREQKLLFHQLKHGMNIFDMTFRQQYHFLKKHPFVADMCHCRWLSGFRVMKPVMCLAESVFINHHTL